MNFLFIVFFTRLLGPAALGTYFLVLAGVNTAAAVSCSWFQQALLRFGPGVAERDEDVAFYVTTLMVLSLVLTIVGGVAWLASDRLPIVAVPLVVSTVWFRVLQSHVQSRNDSAFYSLSASVFAVSRYVAAGLLFYTLAFRDENSLLGGLLAAQTAVAVWMAWRMMRRYSLGPVRLVIARPRKWVQRVRPYLTYGGPMMGFMLVSEARPLVDRLLLAVFLSAEAVGVYSSNYSIGTNVIGLLSLPMMLTAHPMLMALANTADAGQVQFRAAHRALMQSFLVASGALIVVTIPNSYLIAKIALDAEYVGGYPVLALAIVGCSIGNFATYTGKTLEVLGRTRTMLAANAASLVVGAAAAWLLIPTMGMVGAAVGYVIAMVLYTALTVLLAPPGLVTSIPWRMLCAVTVAVGLTAAAAELWVDDARVAESAGVTAGGLALLTAAATFASPRWPTMLRDVLKRQRRPAGLA